MKTRLIAYWIVTGLLVFALLSGAAVELTRQPGTIADMSLLGYPVYFVMLIGVWKVLGSAALLAPGFPRLKEWAYAGIFFLMTGAFVSHLVRGDYGAGGFHLIVTLSLVALTVASWALRPQSRTLGVLFPSRAPAPDPSPARSGAATEAKIAL
jgi:hypothetical protein